MLFLIIAHDYSDAMERRLACRDEHMACIRKFKASGHLLLGGAMLGDDNDMMGSLLVGDFESKQALEDIWLNEEPYFTNKVWEHITIRPYKVGPSFTESIEQLKPD